MGLKGVNLSERQLWYVRHAGAAHGPFPNQVVASHVLLGRFALTDQVSMDQLEWQPLATVRTLLPLEILELQTENDPEKKKWLEERIRAAHRWADERTHDERRLHEATVDSGVRGDDRRLNSADPDVLALPHLHPVQERARSRWPYLGAIFAVGALLSLVMLGVTFFQTVNPVKVGVMPEQAQCQQAAAPRVDWSGCDHHESSLQGVDLSDSKLDYANLARANLSATSFSLASLIGANLSEADLTGADMEGANLSYSDFRRAKLGSTSFRGAVLDHAIWTDGRECTIGSLGQCK